MPVETNDVWYDSAGNTYSELPQNLSYSIVLSRNEIPDISDPYIKLQKEKTAYECEEPLNIDDLTVTYYNEHGVPTKVSSYTTNASEIDMSTAGKKTLIVTYNDGTNTLTEELELTVTEKEIEEPSIIPVENILLNMTSLSLKVNETATLKATVTPDNASDATITWTSSDKSVAKVENGIVTAIASGECTITATAGDKEAVCSVNVSESGSEDIIASGEYNDIAWVIDSNGKLAVEGYGDFAFSSDFYSSSYYEKYYNRAPWYEYRDSIRSAEINVEDMRDASFMFYGCGNMTSVDLANFDTSRINNMYSMFRDCRNLKSLDLSNFITRNVYHMGYMFGGCKSLTDLDLSSFNTSQVTEMDNMFSYCSSLLSLDLGNFDVSNVSTMDSMFWECSALVNLNLDNFNTSNQLMYIADMFDGCSSLVELDLSSFDGSGVRDFLSFFGDENTFSMFEGCNSLITIYTPYNLMGRYQLPVNIGDIWYQPDGTEITCLPTGCDSMIITRNEIPTIKNSYITATLRKTEYSVGSSIDTEGLIVKYYKNDGSVTIVDNYTTNADEIDMSTAGKKTLIVTYNDGTNTLTEKLELTVTEKEIEEPSIIPVESIVLDKAELSLKAGETTTLKVTVTPDNASDSAITWTSSDESVAEVEDGVVTAVASGECTITASADGKDAVCSVNVAESESGDIIASGEYKDLNSDIAWVIDANGKLTVEGYGNFAASSDIYASSYYEKYYNRAPWYDYRDSIKSAEIKVEDMWDASFMFYACKNLTNINLRNFDTRRISNMYGMFDGCGNLRSLDLSRFNTKNVKHMSDMFWGCRSLKNLDLRSFDTANVTDMRGMFGWCSSLTSLNLSSFDTRNVSDMSFMFSGCGNLADLDLSGFKTEFAVLRTISWMFEGCSSLVSLDLSGLDGTTLRDGDIIPETAEIFQDCDNLNTIYTPYNLDNDSYPLPVKPDDVWYTPDGSEITELPTLCDSMVIMRNKIPTIEAPYITATIRKTEYSVGTSIDAVEMELIVRYYKNDGTVTIVDDYTINEDEIDMSTVGKKTLVVTYNGLITEVEFTVLTIPVESIRIDKHNGISIDKNISTLVLKIGGTVDLSAMVKPSQATYSKVTWNSSDESVAEVIGVVHNNVMVRAVSSGVCTITASAGGKEKDFKVIVTSGQFKDDIAGGTSGNITWRIDYNGKLTVTGTGDFNRIARDDIGLPPWYDNRADIITAEVNISGMTIADSMFYECSNLTSIDLSGFDTADITEMGWMFSGCTSLESLDVSNFDTSNVQRMEAMFDGCSSLSNLDLSNFDTSNVIYGNGFSEMFSQCSSLVSLDLSNFDTSSIKNMSEMFLGCSSLESLDLSSFNTDNVKSMSNMFSYCSSLKHLDLSNFNTGNVKSMSDMFSGCSSLKYLDLSNFNTSNVTDMGSMFDECSNLTSLHVGNFDTGNVTDMFAMFRDCSSLRNLDVSSFDTANVTNMTNMFWGCSSLTSLDLSSFDVGEVEEISGMFGDNHNLDTVYTPRNLKYSVEFGSIEIDPENLGEYITYIWYDTDGNTYTGLPQNLNYSIIITRDRKPVILPPHIVLQKTKTSYVYGQQLNINDLIVTYYDDQGMPSRVNKYTTNANEIDMSTLGTKILTAIYNDGINTYTADLELEVTIESILLNKSALTLETGETDKLLATVLPDDFKNLGITWESSDNSVAMVEDGIVTAVARGDCIISASTGGKSAVCNVVVVASKSLDDIASGDIGNVRWLIDHDGKLIVEGNGDFINPDVSDKAPWFNECDYIKSAEINLKDTTSTAYMFDGCKNLVSVDFSKFYTDKVKDMSGMFRGCSSLSLHELIFWDDDRNNIFNTENVTNMKDMFKGCSNLTDLDLGNFDTGSVVDMSGMFEACSGLVKLDLENFCLIDVTDMSCMFRDCNSLSNLRLGFYAENVKNMDNMFQGCSKLEILDLREFNAYNVKSASGMLTECFALSAICAPCNMKQSVALPIGISESGADLLDIWYDSDGNTYTELPQNLNDSIVIMKNQQPVVSNCHITVQMAKTEYEYGEWISTDDFMVIFYDENGMPEIVTNYCTTNMYDLDMYVPGTKKFVVCYKHYEEEYTETIEITVKNKGEVNVDSDFKVCFKDESDQVTPYTGSSITPEIKVTYGVTELTAGTDYTIKYSNNVKPGIAKITVTGKGNYTSNKSVNFNIVQADINAAVLAGIDENAELVVVSGSKLNTTLYYNNQKLTAKDYAVGGEVSTSRKLLDSDNGKKIIIEGKRNFTGSREVILRVVNKNSLTKFTVSLDKNKLNSLTYDGKEHYIHDIEGAITVVGKDGNADMKRGMDYTIVYPNNVTDAGVKKFTVVGLGRYTGTVSKSYTIKPAAPTAGIIEVEYEGGNVENIKLPFISTGVTFNDRLTVTYTKNGNPLVLKEGKDYKISYAGNKKVGNKAKFTISFLGNYKGNKKQTRTFTIEKGNLENAKVIVADKVYKGKAGIYKSAPYVIEPGTNKLLKSTNYTVTYYTDETRNVEMKGKNKVTAGDTVYVRIEAKSNGNYKTDNPIIKTYKVLEAVDLSKSKITFLDTATGVTTKKTEYTGNPITDREIKVMVNGKSVDKDEDIVVTYVNNINKGKATVIVTGTGEAGCKYIGSKTATFNIVAYSLR